MADELRTQHRINLGRRLQEKREDEGWTREQVAEMTGFTLATIRKVEEGVFNVPIDVVSRIADIYGCELVFQSKE
jgi:transcriptional regulator with XRE-family HTH domain